jgi:hypothetical protein
MLTIMVGGVDEPQPVRRRKLKRTHVRHHDVRDTSVFSQVEDQIESGHPGWEPREIIPEAGAKKVV